MYACQRLQEPSGFDRWRCQANLTILGEIMQVTFAVLSCHSQNLPNGTLGSMVEAATGGAHAELAVVVDRMRCA